jgi:hypothetical protein
MRIQVTNINTSDSMELEGHEAPILGLTLDPKEEFVVCIVVCVCILFNDIHC